MEPSRQKRKNSLQIAIIVAAILAMLALAFFVFFPRNESKPDNTVVKEDPAVSEDSLKREWERELEREREGYAKEQARFAKVLSEASDEELFVVLNYAIAQHYVPSWDIDPLYNVHVMVGHWQRSLMVYNNLSDRKDLLKKIYPDLKELDNYVRWEGGEQPYPDTIVSKAILKNAKENSQKMDYKLKNEFFGTPLMRY